MINKELEKRIAELEKQVAKLSEPKVCNASPQWRNLNEMTWDEIIEDAKCGREFGIDEYKEFELYTGEKCKAYVLGTNCDRDISKNICPITMMFAVDGEYEMNETDTNEGGWKESKMYKAYSTRFYRLLPNDLNERIALVYKDDCKNDLWLLSYDEALHNEKKYSYFKKGGKFPTGKWWWLRSPIVSNTANFWCVYSGGTNGSLANYSYGVCFAFALS